jgi:hypothetical protein
MFVDPIVEEVHAARAKIAAQCEYDFHKMSARAKELMDRYKGQFTIVTKEEMNQLRHRLNNP